MKFATFKYYVCHVIERKAPTGMAKRFTDTNKYNKQFFRGLPGPYKLLYDYLYHDCDHAGIWIVDFEIAQVYIGKDMPVNETKALELFNNDEQRIYVFKDGARWFIPGFIEFQYGPLNRKNRVHNSIIKILKSYGLLNIFKGLTSPLDGVKDKEKDIYNNISKDNARVNHSNNLKLIMAEFPHIDCRVEYDKFINHCQANGRKFQDPMAAFRYWLLSPHQKTPNQNYQAQQTAEYLAKIEQDYQRDPVTDETLQEFQETVRSLAKGMDANA